jgi:hypothetical protein
MTGRRDHDAAPQIRCAATSWLVLITPSTLRSSHRPLCALSNRLYRFASLRDGKWRFSRDLRRGQRRSRRGRTGSAFKLSSRRLKDEFRRHGQMHLLLLRYTQSLLTQMAQTAVCSRLHSVDQQLCRWLLLSYDRLPSNQLSMTQGLVANVLGVRRERVTIAAAKLQKLAVISYSRGVVTILDRQKLEHLCCECYAVVKRETDRLRPKVASNR